MTIRLGDVLVRWGVLTSDQREQVLDAQRLSSRPFGVLAEEMFGINPRSVEDAWAEQLSTMSPWIDPNDADIEPEIAETIDRRQAWQFRLIPVRAEGEEIVFVTAPTDLARAMRFVGWRIAKPFRFEFCTETQLDEALKTRYPMGGADPSKVARYRSQPRCVVQEVSPLQFRR